MSLYELAILGSPTGVEREALTETLRGMVEDFGLALGRDVLVHDGATVSGRDKRAAFAAAFFGAPALADLVH